MHRSYSTHQFQTNLQQHRNHIPSRLSPVKFINPSGNQDDSAEFDGAHAIDKGWSQGENSTADIANYREAHALEALRDLSDSTDPHGLSQRIEQLQNTEPRAPKIHKKSVSPINTTSNVIKPRPIFKVGGTSGLFSNRNTTEYNTPREHTKYLVVDLKKSRNYREKESRIYSEPMEKRQVYPSATIGIGLGLELQQNVQRVDRKLNMQKNERSPFCNVRLSLSSQVNKLGDNSHSRLIQELKNNKRINSIKEVKSLLADNATKLLVNRMGLRKALYLCTKRESEESSMKNPEKSGSMLMVGKNFSISKLGEELDFLRENDLNFATNQKEETGNESRLLNPRGSAGIIEGKMFKEKFSLESEFNDSTLREKKKTVICVQDTLEPWNEESGEDIVNQSKLTQMKAKYPNDKLNTSSAKLDNKSPHEKKGIFPLTQQTKNAKKLPAITSKNDPNNRSKSTGRMSGKELLKALPKSLRHHESLQNILSKADVQRFERKINSYKPFFNFSNREVISSTVGRNTLNITTYPTNAGNNRAFRAPQ